jgi:hypothetical protein
MLSKWAMADKPEKVAGFAGWAGDEVGIRLRPGSTLGSGDLL